LRRRKRDVLGDLPPKLVSDVTVALGRARRESYERTEREGVVELYRMGEAVTVESVLELIIRLKQICNFCPVTGQSAKLEDLVARLEELQEEGSRALVFSQFVDSSFGAAAIARRLRAFRPLLYTGAMSAARRDAVVRQFRERPEHRVLVLSPRAGGQGLNLQDASHVFHFDRWWNPAVERQAEDRSHRLGQTLPVNVYRYISEGTVEERIAEVLRDKQLLFDEMVDDVSLDPQERLSAEDLFGLFGLAPE
jgi:SNF2 family DNA or RNA helicase